MKITQLSIFLENKPGSLTTPCRLLAQAGINLLTLSLADTQQFGILRLIVRHWKKAKEVLEAGGCVVKVTEVMAVEVPDRPGGLADILQAIEKAGINLEYMYAFTEKQENKGMLVFRFSEPEKAAEVLKSAGINVLGEVELYGRFET
jgi:hypothetical protein